MLIDRLVTTGDTGLAEASLYFFHDEQNVAAASAGFSWNNPNWVMDSAVWSPQADTAFNFFKFEYINNSLDSTNAYQRFQCVGARVFGDGLPASADPQWIITYYFHRVGPDTGDSLCIALDDFMNFRFVDLTNSEYEPMWRGDVCSDQEEPPDTTIYIIENPLNGHTYQFVRLRGFVSWHTARQMAESAGGYLATITDSVEADIVRRLLAHPGDEAWLGGTDEAQEGVWTWITGEPWDYTNWYPGEPNASQPDEDYLLAQHILGGRWVDVFDDNSGYIIERNNELPSDTLINLTQWPVSDGGNGHWYALIPQQMNWFMADSLAGSFEINGSSGHLATVRSAEENAFITQHVLPGAIPDTVFAMKTEFWLGGFMTIAGWHWVTGEPFDYQNWADTIPGGYPDYAALAIIGPGWDVNPPLPGQWVSRLPECGYGGYPCRWAVIEFDTEPTHPPRVLHVPEEFPTIQLAIDSTRHGDEVLVAPGTYHESINFHGKNITVRSTHGPQVTTITNHRTANLVTFDHGENSRAVLDGFLLRGGWMAVLCVGSGPTISRNICLDQNVWNWSAIGLCGSLIVVNDPTGDPRYSAIIGPAPAVIVNNTITHSANGGISTFSSVPPVIKNNIVVFNAHYGIHHQNLTSQPQPIIGYNDVFGHGYHQWGPYGDYINIPDPGPGAISADPMFDRSYGLLPGSPCIDAGDPHPRYNDPDGTRNDMGAVYHPQEPGGGVTPTDEWIVVYCSGVINEVPPLPGSTIRAYDPDGVLCGQAVVHWDGSFGLMPVYRDDEYTDFDEGAEPGDLIRFTINGRDVISDPPVYWTANGDVYEVCRFDVERCLRIPLHFGWNLISWNVAFESEIYDALSDIIGCLDVVHSFEGGALTFDPDLDAFNTLTHVDYHHGYWMRMRCDTILTVCGDRIMPYEAIYCEPGWNLVSYWPPDPLPVEEALFSLMPRLQQAMGFDQAAQIWLPDMQPFNTLTELRPSFGYWAKVDEWLPLLYPGFFPMDCTSTDIYVRERSFGSTSFGSIETSRTWISVYGKNITVDGDNLPEGATIEFFSRENALCGKGVYTGDVLKLTPIYGHDESGDASKLYPNEGDEIAIFINGSRVYPDLRWDGNGSRVHLSHLTVDSRGLPQTFVLKQNYPNPFNPGTIISFEVPADGHVNLSVYNVLGQTVRTLLDEDCIVGRYDVEWNGTDDNGDRVATGIYFYRLTTGDEVKTKKMLLLK